MSIWSSYPAVPTEHGAGGGLRPEGLLYRRREESKAGPAGGCARVYDARRTVHGSAAQTVQPVDGERVGVSTRTLRRRLSSVPGLYAFLHVRGDVATNPVPRGLPTRRERQRPGQGVPLVRGTRTLPR